MSARMPFCCRSKYRYTHAYLAIRFAHTQTRNRNRNEGKLTDEMDVKKYASENMQMVMDAKKSKWR